MALKAPGSSPRPYISTTWQRPDPLKSLLPTGNLGAKLQGGVTAGSAVVPSDWCPMRSALWVPELRDTGAASSPSETLFLTLVGSVVSTPNSSSLRGYP